MVEAIERLPMSDTSKLDMLLTWRGEKRATDTGVVLKTWSKGENPPEVTTEDKKKIIDNAKAVFRSMGLFSVDGEDVEREPYTEDEESDHPIEVPGNKHAVLYISPIKEDAEKLQKLWQEDDEVKNAREIGKMYGFPPSTIEAYGQFFEQGFRKGFKNREMTIEQGELPENVQNQDFMAFAQFRLSRNSWQEELKTAERWAGEIKNIDPALYERVVADYHRDRKK